MRYPALVGVILVLSGCISPAEPLDAAVPEEATMAAPPRESPPPPEDASPSAHASPAKSAPATEVPSMTASAASAEPSRVFAWHSDAAWDAASFSFSVRAVRSSTCDFALGIGHAGGASGVGVIHGDELVGWGTGGVGGPMIHVASTSTRQFQASSSGGGVAWGGSFSADGSPAEFFFGGVGIAPTDWDLTGNGSIDLRLECSEPIVVDAFHQSQEAIVYHLGNGNAGVGLRGVLFESAGIVDMAEREFSTPRVRATLVGFGVAAGVLEIEWPEGERTGVIEPSGTFLLAEGSGGAWRLGTTAGATVLGSASGFAFGLAPVDAWSSG